MLRVPAVVLCVLLAGCAQPAEDDEDPLFGLCPQWLQGPGEERVDVRLDATNLTASVLVQPEEDGELRAKHLDRHLDLYRVTLTAIAVSEGTVQLRAYASDEQKAIRDYRLEAAQLLPVVHLTSDDEGKEFDVALTSISQDLVPAPAALRLNFTYDPVTPEGTASITGEVTFHYRVCGAEVSG